MVTLHFMITFTTLHTVIRKLLNLLLRNLELELFYFKLRKIADTSGVILAIRHRLHTLAIKMIYVIFALRTREQIKHYNCAENHICS